jgi:hypothetical protein
MSFTGVGGHPAIMAASGKLLSNDPEARAVRTEGLSPRQQELDRRWAYYRTRQYDSCKVAWDGSRVVGQVERDGISMAGYVPPGFYIANSETLPIQFRKPTSPYHLTKVVVDRFTSLLFGQKRHPKITVKGDADTEDYINAVVEEGRLWPQMMLARSIGGATGTSVVGFKVIEGKPQFEVFDPRWCEPRFLDRANLILESLDYRYKFKQEIRDPESGDWVEVEFWYRRLIDVQRDVIFEPVLVDPRVQPEWKPATAVSHSLGFCPVAWIQNEQNLEEVDGDPDCLGIYDKCDMIDRLLAQSDKGVIANCDPTVVIATDAQMGDVRKGSSNALKLPANSTATYMEMTGEGITQAREQVQMHKEDALEVVCCVIEQSDGSQKTATEIERNYAAMLARADKFREQYGEMGVKRLINMVIVAAVTLNKPRSVDGSITRYTIKLPARDDGRERRLGRGPFQATLTWPPYFEPSLDDAGKAVSAAGTAKQAGLIDQEHATKYVAPFFQIEDPGALSKQIVQESDQYQDSLDQMSLQGAKVDEPKTSAPSEDPTDVKQQDTAFNGAQVTALVELVAAVAKGSIPASAAKVIVLVSFPAVTQEQADRMLSGIGGGAPAVPE